MVIFNSYVKLPESNSIHLGGHLGGVSWVDPPFATGPCRCPLDLRTASRWKNWWRRQAAPARPPKKRFEDADREHRSCNGRSGNLETQKSWKIIILKMNYTQKNVEVWRTGFGKRILDQFEGPAVPFWEWKLSGQSLDSESWLFSQFFPACFAVIHGTF